MAVKGQVVVVPPAAVTMGAVVCGGSISGGGGGKAIAIAAVTEAEAHEQGVAGSPGA